MRTVIDKYPKSGDEIRKAFLISSPDLGYLSITVAIYRLGCELNN